MTMVDKGKIVLMVERLNMNWIEIAQALLLDEKEIKQWYQQYKKTGKV